MEYGTILCMKTTGELVFVLGQGENGDVRVRRPVMTRDGIDQQVNFFHEAELETIEEHLRHEAKEMVLKSKIQEEILNELGKKDKKPDVRVN